MQPIRYFNRHTGKVETESVYGEEFLRWTYGNPVGRLALHLIARRAWFSYWYGWRMKRPATRAKIGPFIKRYGIAEDEMLLSPGEFENFNDFFTRRLKADARPIDPDDRALVFPADGRHLGFANVAEIRQVFVKGQQFDLDLLLMDAGLANRYREGALLLSRLCPVDYHRFHFPASGNPSAPWRIPGSLFSVNPIALRQKLGYLWSNKRQLTLLQTEHVGTVLMIEIGATCVGSIRQSYEINWPVAKGQEKGWFEFGGSSIVTLFESGRVRLAADLLENTCVGRELYARMGTRLAEVA